jgi:signal transduction histidine kinase
MAWAAALTAAALLAAYAAVTASIGAFVAERYGSEMAATARAIMAASDFDERGVFAVDPGPADPRFAAPGSGWAWQVSDGETALARSASLLSGDLGPDGRGPAPGGAALDRVRLDFTAPGDGRALSVVVAMPAGEREAAVAVATRPLAVALAALGGGLLLAQLLAARLALGGLDALRRDVAGLAQGRVDRLPEPRAPDLAPLAREMNRLIAAQSETVARARAHVGNLAHALKGPLAVLRNEADGPRVALIERMERSIRWHLGRARAAGAGAGVAVETPVASVVEDLRLVLGPEAARRGVTLAFAVAPDLRFAGEREDLTEMLGNLLDNAVKWARAETRLDARVERERLIVAIADDGPGVPAEARAALTARGARLDESAPGHGLGLAIVADLAALYGGALTLDRAGQGGLRARLDLPAAR